MGEIRNEMVIVHHWNRQELEEVREDAIKFLREIASKDFANFNVYGVDSMVSSIMNTYINQEYTFAINGDCSELGWEMSKRFHEARMEWCEKHRHDVQNIVVIIFGKGDEPCDIVFDSKAESEDEK